MDVGGTFTDVVLLDAASGRVVVDKTLTTPGALLDGVRTGVQSLLSTAGVDPGEVTAPIVHATTIVTNSLIENKTGRAGLVTTAGFADTLLIRDEHRYDMYDLQIEFAPPPIGPELTFEIAERTSADGRVLNSPSRKEVAEVAVRMADAGVESVAVCLLNSYVNPANERVVAEMLEGDLGVPVCCSAEVSPQIREYPRMVTAACNAATMPVIGPYLDELQQWLASAGFAGGVLMMLSNGGVVSAAEAARNPIRLVESGPAAGALAGTWLARRFGESRLLCFDMGGTTAKACLIDSGEPTLTNTFEVARVYRFKKGSGMPVSVPSVDLVEIGAGGGSVARLDQFGLLKVGPESAGADPGPASYSLGGTDAAVTDADVVLGLLDPDAFLGGDMPLDASLAQSAVAAVASGLGLPVADTAAGIHEVVNQNMADAARMHGVEQGIDLRGVPLLAFGGAGPVHACGVAELLEADRVIFPVNAGVLSAFGTLVSPVRIDLARSMPRRLGEVDASERDGLLDELRLEGRRVLSSAGVPGGDVRFRYGIDARYEGQGNEVTVWVGEGESWPAGDEQVREAFEVEYRNIYGLTIPDVAVEVVTWRMSAYAPPPRLAEPGEPGHAHGDGRDLLDGDGGGPGAPTPGATRLVTFESGSPLVEVPVFRRDRLTSGDTISGPAIVEERETTNVIRPGWNMTVAPDASLVATRAAAGGARVRAGAARRAQRDASATNGEGRVSFDPVELEILWQSLISTVNEQARALQRAAFSPIVREAGDLANAVFDRRGRMVAQAVTGTPGHINSLAMGAANMLEEFPVDSLAPGDVLITNDPYKTAGQLLDVTVLVPAWRVPASGGAPRLIALFGSTIHHTDVGGYGIGAGGRDCFEEGLWIPICKLMNGAARSPGSGSGLGSGNHSGGGPVSSIGERNGDVWRFILSNVRQPDHMAGDLHAQMASGEVGAQRLAALCDAHGLDDIEDLADEIIERSEAATRANIAELSPGRYQGDAVLDLVDGSKVDIVCALDVDPAQGEITVDYQGSSPASPWGINVVRNYTHAYTTFTVRSVLNPDIPNNHGSLAPIKLIAPEGSIVCAVPPQPGTARHVVGMFLPNALLKALAQVKPAESMAEGAGAVWTMQVNGHHDDGRPFITAMFTYAGGVGARAAKPGLNACSYPTGVSAVPIEVVEASAPVRFRRKALRPGSGGAGAQSGGLGQTIEFEVDTTRGWQLNAVTSRLTDPPQGLLGGEPGAAGRFLVNGEPVTSQARLSLQPNDVVLLELPGGGGYGPPNGADKPAQVSEPAR